MKLQFLINHFRESPQIVGRLLSSIAAQAGVDPKRDYGAIIASDGDGRPLDRAFLDSFPFPVRYFILPHKGVCPTRNALLDMAIADYVMFCDADDCFSRPDGLAALLGAAYCGADVVSAPFEEELLERGKYRYVKVPQNAVWVHGKLFRRDYLTENAIRFDDAEDSPGEQYFLWQAFHLTGNIRYLSESSYVWKWNSNSVTRAEPYYNVRTYGAMLDTYSRLADNLLARQRPELYAELISDVISAAYADSGRLSAAPEEYGDAAKSALAAFVRRYQEDYCAADEASRRKRYAAALALRRTPSPSAGFDGIRKWMDTMV